jgi:hypothetical protein
MAGAVLIGRVVLAAVFAVTGTAKPADLEGSRSAAGGFGVPEWLVRPVAVTMHSIEIAHTFARREVSARVEYRPPTPVLQDPGRSLR